MRRSSEVIHVRTDHDDGRRKGHGHGGAMRMQSGRDELGRTKTRWPTPAQLERIERMEEEDDDDHETVREIVAPPPANGMPSVETKVQVPEIVEQSVVEGDEWLRTSDGKPIMSLFDDDDDDEPTVRRDGHGGSRRAYGDIGGYHGSKGRWPRDPEVERLEREKEMNKYDNKSKPTTTRKVKVVPTIGKPNQYGATGSYPPHAPPRQPAAGGHQPATSSYLWPIYYH